MRNVLLFPTKEIRSLRGPARCLHCGHEWEAVTPEGIVASLECPQCSLYKGVLQGVTEPDHSTRWVCNCGCDLFYILPSDGCQCLMCGVIASGF